MKNHVQPAFERNELIAFCLLSAAIAPFIIWGIEFFLPYPAMIEELAKACIVYVALPIPGKLTRLKLAIGMGVLFAISESIFYSFNFNLAGSLNPLFAHFAFTSILHAVTFLVITLASFATVNKKYLSWGVGLLIAMCIHYFYNQIVS